MKNPNFARVYGLRAVSRDGELQTRMSIAAVGDPAMRLEPLESLPRRSRENSPMPAPCMPTTIPSPADRGEFDFLASDRNGRDWRWDDTAMVWVRLADEPEQDPCPEAH